MPTINSPTFDFSVAPRRSLRRICQPSPTFGFRYVAPPTSSDGYMPIVHQHSVFDMSPCRPLRWMCPPFNNDQFSIRRCRRPLLMDFPTVHQHSGFDISPHRPLRWICQPFNNVQFSICDPADLFGSLSLSLLFTFPDFQPCALALQ